MSNNVFQLLNGVKAPRMSFTDNLKALQQNPFQFLMQKKLNIPEGMNDPQQIVQHWLNNGTMSQEQFNQLQGKVNSMLNSM